MTTCLPFCFFLSCLPVPWARVGQGARLARAQPHLFTLWHAAFLTSRDYSLLTVASWHLICMSKSYAATLPLLFCNTTACWWAWVVLNRVMLSLVPSCKLGALPGGCRTDALKAEYSPRSRPAAAPRWRHIQAPAANAWQKEWAFPLPWKWWMHTEAFHSLQPSDPPHCPLEPCTQYKLPHKETCSIALTLLVPRTRGNVKGDRTPLHRISLCL